MTKIYSERWKTIADLPEGGQAYVYKVVDIKGDGVTEYVLKRLKNPHRLDRFKKEYEALQKLGHPAIVRVIDFDFDTEKPFFVTEFCERGNLAQQEQLLRAQLPIKIQTFLEICRGLQAAHDKGISHRDIKPENVFVRKDGSVALGDFGLSHDHTEGVRLTASSEPIGSRNYICPENEDGRADQVTHACDIYSLGKLLYWLLSGGNIFSREKFRESQYDLRKFITTDDPFIDQLTEQFNLVLDKMITVRPEDRIPIKEVLRKVQRAERLWTLEYALPTSYIGGALCRYCGQGDYVKCSDSPVNFGIEQRGQQNLRILVCNWCGHVELFRPDHILPKSPARQTGN
ncbi:MAG TPA: serine/threonine-protein kinase [Verrucomicrobiae bacterium]